jgi:hypothetical protein
MTCIMGVCYVIFGLFNVAVSISYHTVTPNLDKILFNIIPHLRLGLPTGISH